MVQGKSGPAFLEDIKIMLIVCGKSRNGKFGLWLDSNLEKGVSSTCATFGNEPLSEEGEKFEIIGVEVWSIGGS